MEAVLAFRVHRQAYEPLDTIGLSDGGGELLIEDLIERIQSHLKNGAYANEAAISFSVLMPILRSLGWDDSDPDQVLPEYASGGRRVDFALCGAGRRPSLFIEVKGVGRALDGDRQLFEYAFHEGIPLCLLTDGRDWSFYLPGGQGSYDDRRVYRLQLNERPPSESARILRRYLERERVRVGDAFEDAMRDYRDIASRREAARNIPTAWIALVEQPEDLLVELLAEQTETISGYRPSSAEVTHFLRALVVPDAAVSRPGSARVKHLGPSNGNASTGFQHRPMEGTSREIEYELLGERRSAPNASAALIEILTAIAARYPGKMREVSEAARGKSRNHIASSPEEIYPARPDLARAAEIGSGWLVGLNIANREKQRIIRETCRVVGLRYGHDVKINMPNTDG
jgi:predicted type IV restriction endonuclease